MPKVDLGTRAGVCIYIYIYIYMRMSASHMLGDFYGWNHLRVSGINETATISQQRATATLTISKAGAEKLMGVPFPPARSRLHPFTKTTRQNPFRKKGLGNICFESGSKLLKYIQERWAIVQVCSMTYCWSAIWHEPISLMLNIVSASRWWLHAGAMLRFRRGPMHP